MAEKNKIQAAPANQIPAKIQQKKKYTEIKRPKDRLDAILEDMGYGKQVPETLKVVEDYIFELGLRKLVSLVKPGDSFELMQKRQRMVWKMGETDKK